MMQRKNIFQIPITDYSFKKIFATEKNKHFLIAFLNSAVSAYTGEIADITYLPTEKYGSALEEKRVVFDIACKDTNDKEFIIEMQRAQQPDFVDRSLVYLGRSLSASLTKGERRYRVMPTYSVNLLDFELAEYRATGECFRAIFFKDQKNRLLTPKIGIFYFNLCNFAAQQEDVSGELRQWLYLLKNMQNLDEDDYLEQCGIFRDLLDECRISKMSKMENETYKKSVLEYEDVQEAVAYAKELAAKEAFEQGIEQGIEQGKAAGIEQGKTEMIKTMLRNGLDIATIVHATGLPEVQILELTKNI
mgnify:CR=1 FL=1